MKSGQNVPKVIIGSRPLWMRSWVVSMGFSLTGRIMAARSILMKASMSIMLTRDQVNNTTSPALRAGPLSNHLGKFSELSILKFVKNNM